MRKEVLALTTALVVVGGVGLGSLAATMITPSRSATCVQLESAPLFLFLRNSSTNAPIASLPIDARQANPVTSLSGGICTSTYPKTSDLGTMYTSPNGSIEVCCTGTQFLFQVVYLGHDYYANVTAEGALAAECVTLSIPSGTTQTTYGPLGEYTC